MLLSIFNYSVKKLLNLESSFLITDTSWKNKTAIILTETFIIVINLSKTCLQAQSFFIVWNEKQIFAFLGTGSLLPRIQNLYKKNFKKTLWPLFMDGIQLPQGYSHFEEAVYFLLFSSPEISGTHFIHLATMKGWVNLGATLWFWTRDPWIGNPAPQALGHCSIKLN